MAKLYPERIPDDIRTNPKRSAECKVYHALSQLPNSFTVFYSVGWQVRDERNGIRDGEADFIVAHHDLGVMILEVKGGGIRYDATLSQWFSRDRTGVEHEIKDPVQQVRDSKGALLTKLNELHGWDNRRLTIGYMVAFPDVNVSQIALRLDLPREIVLDATDLEQIEGRLLHAFSIYARQNECHGALGQDRLARLVGLLARSFTLKTSLGITLAEEDARLIELTEQQMGILHYIQKHRRALIEGCAGSGKTMIALEKACQLAEQGFDVLLLCFNASLSRYLHQRAYSNIDVLHFHELCQSMAKEAGIGFRPSNSDQDYYDNVLPEMLLDAISDLGPQYDAIIVDEGQDFLENWWETLFFLLRDQESGIFYAFYDSNQNIYHRPDSLNRLIEVPPLILWENCRNTQTIHNIVRSFHNTPQDLSCRGPVGRVPEILYFSGVLEQVRIVQSTIHRLVNEEKIESSQIVLLTTRSPDKTRFSPGKQLGNFSLVDASHISVPPNSLRVSSVHRFKGLESRVVILTGLEDAAPNWLNPILYVACSRARTHLIIVAPEQTRAQIDHMRGEINRQSK